MHYMIKKIQFKNMRKKKNLYLERPDDSSLNEALTSPNSHFSFPTITLILFFLNTLLKKKK